jgi:DNA polymerase/3'-5' exonuclease PolX
VWCVLDSCPQAASAIRSLEFPVTSGKAISKGKGKVEGVGDKCGLLIDEFLETGTMSKLEEKRAEVARQ